MHAAKRVFLALPVALALAGAGCGDDPTPGPTAPTPTAITEAFTDTLTVNGGRTHTFLNAQTGAVQATLSAVGPDSATLVGLAIGTWSGPVSNPPAGGSCQQIIAKDNAAQGTTLTGNASIGPFCARVFDVGSLTGPVEYTITVTHF